MKTIRRAEGGASGEMKNTKVLKEDKNHLKDKSILLMSKINNGKRGFWMIRD